MLRCIVSPMKLALLVKISPRSRPIIFLARLDRIASIRPSISSLDEIIREKMHNECGVRSRSPIIFEPVTGFGGFIQCFPERFTLQRPFPRYGIFGKRPTTEGQNGCVGRQLRCFPPAKRPRRQAMLLKRYDPLVWQELDFTKVIERAGNILLFRRSVTLMDSFTICKIVFVDFRIPAGLENIHRCIRIPAPLFVIQ